MSEPRRLPEQAEGYGVVLRRWRPADAQLLHDAVVESREHLRPWMAWIAQEPVSVERRRAMLELWELEWEHGGGVNYAILVGQQVAGSCGFHKRRGPGVLEIGYWVHPSFARRGVATASARVLTDLAFTLPDVDKVQIHHDKANSASAAVPRRLGYVFAGEKPDKRSAPAELGIDCTWDITRERWLEADTAAR